MVFTLDIGNTNICIGCYKEDKLIFVSRIATNLSKMIDQYAVEIRDILSLYNCDAGCFDGAIISSVVPHLTPILREALKKLLHCNIMVVDAGFNHGLTIKIKEPSILGSDLICAAVAAIRQFTLPCIVVDLGTATKIMALDQSGAFLGCSILPGVNISLEALFSRAAQLPQINLESVSEVIGTTSIDSMKSGVVYGTAGSIDGMIDRYAEILGGNASLVATGGLSGVIVPSCKHTISVCPDLVLDGLYEIYKNNA